MRYNPYTQTIEVIDSVRGMENLVTQVTTCSRKFGRQMAIFKRVYICRSFVPK
jgi:hypothetical protein